MRLFPITLAAVLMAGAAFAEDITVGVTPGQHGEILEEVAKVAAPKGLNIKIVEFSDYVVPNQALADGEIEANSFQHQPYLDNQIKDRGFDLVSVGTTITTPMGVYSDKIKSLDALKDGDTVGIPNDPTNGGRALLVLQQLGVIKTDPAVGLTPTVLDITENPKNLKFQELDAAQLPRSLADLDAALINTNYAVASGLDPQKDSFASESAEGPYVNIITVRTEDKDQPWVKDLVEAYHSPEVKAFIEEKYEGNVLTSW